jgi:hypothetical protein
VSMRGIFGERIRTGPILVLFANPVIIYAMAKRRFDETETKASHKAIFDEYIASKRSREGEMVKSEMPESFREDGWPRILRVCLDGKEVTMHPFDPNRVSCDSKDNKRASIFYMLPTKDSKGEETEVRVPVILNAPPLTTIFGISEFKSDPKPSQFGTKKKTNLTLDLQFPPKSQMDEECQLFFETLEALDYRLANLFHDNAWSQAQITDPHLSAKLYWPIAALTRSRPSADGSQKFDPRLGLRVVTKSRGTGLFQVPATAVFGINGSIEPFSKVVPDSVVKSQLQLIEFWFSPQGTFGVAMSARQVRLHSLPEKPVCELK